MSEDARLAPRPDVVDDWLQPMPCRMGELLITRQFGAEFAICHRRDAGRTDLTIYRDADSAIEIARHDDDGAYRPLKTAPNLRHGWILLLATVREVRSALDHFYPARTAAYVAWRADRLRTTSLRDTLNRQTGMYRVAAKIGDEEANLLVASFCRSDGKCLRTIQWKLNNAGKPASIFLPPEKFDPTFDQTGQGERVLPLLCQEACNLLVAAAREVVKAAPSDRSEIT